LTGDLAEAVTALKQTEGPQLQVHGSGDLVQTLLSAGLVDRWHLVIHPVLLGSGRRLFAEGTIPGSLRLLDGRVTKGGTVISTYAPAGDVVVGSFG
jgi:dihydrofolate reductase